MAKMYCEVSKGLRDAEASITVYEHDKTPQHFPLDRGLVSRAGNRNAIPVRILATDEEQGIALVTLPVEADSGASRIWVDLDNLILAQKEPAK